jgi:hypothetical protein
MLFYVIAATLSLSLVSSPSASTSTAAKGASATLARDQASVSIIAKGTIASNATEQSSASIVVDSAGARNVLLRPTPLQDVKSRCKRRGMQARCAGQA